MPVVINGTTGISGVDGSAGTPSYQGNDTNTGVFFPAADVIAFSTNGTEDMRIDSSGNVLIGTTSIGSNGRFQVGGGRSYFGANGSVYAINVAFDNTRATAGQGYYLGATNSATPDFVVSDSGGSERMRITSGGNVGIGTSSPDARLTAIGSDNIASTKIASFYANNLSQGIYIGYDGIATTASGQPMRFTVGSTAEAMRISSAGDVAIGSSVAGSGKLYTKNDANQWTGYFENGSASLTAGVLALVAGRNTTNNTFKAIVYYNAGAGVDRFIVQDSGNVQNTNNSYGAISDIKVKENIVDATPKLADLCKVKVRQYNLKSDPTHKQIGVVAQELEEVFPKLVEESIDTDKDGNNLGTTTKAVKYSVFVPMLIKAMQEQQAMIEELKAKVAALETK